MISGRCEYGRVRYEVDGEIEEFSHCHCSQCRRWHGAAYATFAAVARDKFQSTSGETDTLDLSMSSVDGNPPHPEGFHAYVGSKAPWHEICDELEQYESDSSG